MKVKRDLKKGKGIYIRRINRKKIVGFAIDKNGKLQLVKPGFMNKCKDEINEYFEFFKLLKKYVDDKNNQMAVKEKGNFRRYVNLNIKKDEIHLIELYFSILNDYKNNGLLFIPNMKYNNQNKGSINWSKTMHSRSEIVTSDYVIFNQFIYNNKYIDYRHPLTLLHAYTLNKIFKAVSARKSFELDHINIESHYNFELKASSILRDYRKIIFSDRQRKVFYLLRNLYSEESAYKMNTQIGQHLIYTEDFEYIWEHMLKTILKNDPSIHKLPEGEYKIIDYVDSENSVLINGLKPNPDIMIEYEEGKYLIILDAKDYNIDIKNKRGFPQSTDIYKQILYKYLMSKEFSKSNKYSQHYIINAFLFPAVLDNEKLIEYIGRHSFMKPFEHVTKLDIMCFVIDFVKLRNAYIYNLDKYCEEIISYIVSKYEEIKSKSKTNQTP